MRTSLELALMEIASIGMAWKATDLTNESLIALMSCDWEGEGLSLYMMGLIQEEFNARNLSN